MIDNDVEEITFGDDFARPCALIIFLIFFIKTIFSVVEKDYYFAIILSVVGVCLTGIFILHPKAPRKILNNKKNGVIDIVNYYPAKDLRINVEDISRVDWGGVEGILTQDLEFIFSIIAMKLFFLLLAMLFPEKEILIP